MTENLPPRVLRAANLAVLENIILRFELPKVAGIVALRNMPTTQHVQLEFRSSNGRLIRGRFFHEEVLSEPGKISRLIEESAAFMSEVSRCNVTELQTDSPRLRAA